MNQTSVRLRNAELHVELLPALGGSIGRFDWTRDNRRRPVLRGGAAIGSVLDTACFPLVPFVNRIRDGRFVFRGREVELKPNMAGDPSPLHGQGWLGAWTVDDNSETTAILSFTHDAGEWPWTYEAQQHFSLDRHGLSVDLSCRNLSADPMPCGLGQHPYFPCGSGTTIDTMVTHAWTIDDRILPVARVPAIDHFDLSDRPVCRQGLDHGFGGWSGTMQLTDPDWPFDLEMRSPTARFFQLFSPLGGDFVAAEPVSHANAALNAPEDGWAALGLTVLQPGAEAKLSMRIEILLK